MGMIMPSLWLGAAAGMGKSMQEMGAEAIKSGNEERRLAMVHAADMEKEKRTNEAKDRQLEMVNKMNVNAANMQRTFDAQQNASKNENDLNIHHLTSDTQKAIASGNNETTLKSGMLSNEGALERVNATNTAEAPLRASQVGENNAQTDTLTLKNAQEIKINDLKIDYFNAKNAEDKAKIKEQIDFFQNSKESSKKGYSFHNDENDRLVVGNNDTGEVAYPTAKTFPEPTKQALDYLKQHPDKVSKDYFRQTYGFLPE